MAEKRVQTVEERIAMLNCGLDARTGVLKACMLINAGAAAAILTFIGHALTSDNRQPELAKDLATSLVWFCVGLIATMGGGVFSFLQVRQLPRAYEKDEANENRWVKFFTGAMFTCWLVAAGCFVGGVLVAKHQFLKERPVTPTAETVKASDSIR